MNIFKYKLWVSTEGVISSGSMEAKHIGMAKKKVLKTINRKWNSEWRRDGCSIEGADPHNVAWICDTTPSGQEIMLFVYKKEGG